MEDSLRSLCERGARMVRLDAYGYATKKKDTRCFFEVNYLCTMVKTWSTDLVLLTCNEATSTTLPVVSANFSCLLPPSHASFTPPPSERTFALLHCVNANACDGTGA